MPGNECAEEHIPNTVSAAFHSKRKRLPDPKPVTAGISYAHADAANPIRKRVQSHDHVFKSGSARLPEHRSATKDADHVAHPGVGAARATGGASAAFRAKAARWKHPQAVTKDVDIDAPRGVGDADGKGISPWHPSKSHHKEHKDDSGFAPRFRQPKPVTKDVVPHVPKGMGDVDTTRPHPIFKKPEKADRFTSPRPVTADVDPGDHGGLAHDVARGRTKGAALSGSKRFVEYKATGGDSYHVDSIGAGARSASAWGRSSAKRFPDRKHPTANVSIDPAKGIGEGAGVRGGHAHSREARFKHQPAVTANVEGAADYSTMGKSKGGVIHSKGRRFRDPHSHTKDCDHYELGGIGTDAEKNRGAHSAGFKSEADRFRTRAPATKDVEYLAHDGIAQSVSKGKSKGGAHIGRSDRFGKHSALTDISCLDADHPHSIAGGSNTRWRSHSTGAPGMRSRSPRFKPHKHHPRESEELGDVRGLAYVINKNQNTFSSRHGMS
eukprot:Hpha_TRINITY_DN12259_c0_g1::TRINITY_DN12259_c0_g1_i1::g.16760::m.16760